MHIKDKHKSLLQGWGEWAIDEVQFTSPKRAWISYKKRVTNASVYYLNVSLNFIDRMKGITLDEKVQSKANALSVKLEQHNMKIRDFKKRAKSIQI